MSEVNVFFVQSYIYNSTYFLIADPSLCLCCGNQRTDTSPTSAVTGANGQVPAFGYRNLQMKTEEPDDDMPYMEDVPERNEKGRAATVDSDSDAEPAFV